MADYEEYCFECEANGEDWYADENGEVVCACDYCWVRATMTQEIEKDVDDDV